jgi:hypothetical protein
LVREGIGGNCTWPPFSNRRKATLAELTLSRPLASRQPTARQNSSINSRRDAGAGPWERRLNRASNSRLTHRPQTRTAPIIGLKVNQPGADV